MKIKILLNFHGKYSKNNFWEIDLFDFTSFFGLDFLNFQVHCGIEYYPDHFSFFFPYSHNHHVLTNNDNCSSTEWVRQHEPRSFSKYLHDAGYTTGGLDINFFSALTFYYQIKKYAKWRCTLHSY